MENNKEEEQKNLAKEIALEVLKNYEQKHKDGVVKVSNVATPPTPSERAEKLHSKVRAAYMKKLLPGLDKK